MSEIHIPDWNEYFMRHVYLVASKSKDPRTKIGAVLIKDKSVISEGYNGFPRGVVDEDLRYTDRETKYKYVVHAEHNAILNCARYGISTVGTIMYTQGVPCNECAKAIIQAGVKEVVVHAQCISAGDKWTQAANITRLMFAEAGIPILVFNQVLGVKGLSDGQIVDV